MSRYKLSAAYHCMNENTLEQKYTVTLTSHKHDARLILTWQDIHYILLDEKSQLHTEQLMLYNL